METSKAKWTQGRNEAHELQKHGYDGLWNPDGDCACQVSDLYPCGERGDNCSPGYKIPCPQGDGCDLGCGQNGWHISSSKPLQPWVRNGD